MKRFSIIFVLIFCWMNAKPQVYQKLLPGPVTSFMVVDLGFLAKPENGSYKIPGCSPTPASADSGYWQIYGDTVYKNIAYKHVYDNGALVGIIREDTLAKKIYFRTYCDTTPELLLYDFSLQQGDTISYSFPFSTAGNIRSGIFTVDSIHMLYNAANRYSRHFFLSNHDSIGQTLEIAEGVGSLTHPLFPYYWFSQGVLSSYAAGLSHPPLYFTRLVSCKWDDSVKIYSDTVAYFLADSGQKTVTVTIHDSCDYTSRCCVAATDEFAHASTQVFPNPASDLLYLRAPKEGISCDLLNSVGSIVLEKRLQDHSGITELSVQDLPPGIYLLRIHFPGSTLRKRICIEH